MGKSLYGKVIAIAGASSGIGAATALAIAEKYGKGGGEAVKLVIGARRVDKLEALAKEMRSLGAVVEVVGCDVAQREQVEHLVQVCVDKYQRLDVMFANAGYGLTGTLMSVTEAQFDDIVQVNVKGTLYAMQAAAKVMIPQRSGHIVITSSAAARRGLPLYGIYSMTKAAQLSLAEAMRVELRHQLAESAGRGAKKSGGEIMISTVHPVTTETEFFATAAQKSGIPSSGLSRSQTAQQVGKKICRLLEHPKPELWPMGISRLGLSMSTFFPGMTDKAMGKMLPRRLVTRPKLNTFGP